MIPNYIKSKIQKVEELIVMNTDEIGYKFDHENNTLYIPINETEFNFMFSDCSFKKIELCLGNKIESLDAMFYKCKNLQDLVFTQKLDLSNVKSMAGLFHKCSSLTFFDFRDIITSDKLINIQHLFSDCVCLTRVDFGSNFHSKNVRSIKYLFYNCRNLKNINWNEGQAFYNVECTQGAFFNCTKLKQLDLRGLYFNKVKVLSAALYQVNPSLKILVNSTLKKEMIKLMETL